MMCGYDSKRRVRNILTIAGRKATNPATANVEIGNFAEDARIK